MRPFGSASRAWARARPVAPPTQTQTQTQTQTIPTLAPKSVETVPVSVSVGRESPVKERPFPLSLLRPQTQEEWVIVALGAACVLLLLYAWSCASQAARIARFHSTMLMHLVSVMGKTGQFKI